MRRFRGIPGPFRLSTSGTGLFLFGLLSLIRPLYAQTSEDALAELRASLATADRAVGDSAQRIGLARALLLVGTERLVLVYPGAPVLAGQQAVQGWFGLQRSLDSVAIDWSPLHVEVSADGSFGVSYGLTAIAARTPAGAPIHFGNYLSAWRRTGPEWRMVAHAQLNLGDLAKASSPGFTAALPPPLNPGHPSIAFARADSAFAAQAAREGAERAFAAFASSDAVTFPPGGPLTRGPAAIGRGVRDGGTPSQWAWHPVAVGGSDGGDLGFTVGEAEIRRGAGSGVYYGKYLTLWRREAGGAIRFLADGGSARPAPAGQ